MTLRVGIIGAGVIAPQHLRACARRDEVEVVALAALATPARADLVAEFGIPHCYDDHRTMLEKEQLDAVAVCVPTFLHRRMVCDALAAGAHVIVEKPIARNLDEADEMIAAAERAERLLYVSLNQRFIPEHRKAKELADAGAIGQPLYYRLEEVQDVFIRLDDPGHWFGTWEQGGGGGLMETGTHLIDLALWLGGKVRSVTAVARQVLARHPNKGDDMAAVVLEHESGVMGLITVFCDALASPTEHKAKDLYGTLGSLHVDLDDSVAEHLVLCTTDPVRQRKPTPEDPFPPKAILRQPVPVAREWPGAESLHWWDYSVQRSVTHFLDCLLTGQRPEVTAHDARQALATVLAAYQSSAGGQRVNMS